MDRSIGNDADDDADEFDPSSSLEAIQRAVELLRELAHTNDENDKAHIYAAILVCLSMAVYLQVYVATGDEELAHQVSTKIVSSENGH